MTLGPDRAPLLGRIVTAVAMLAAVLAPIAVAQIAVAPAAHAAYVNCNYSSTHPTVKIGSSGNAGKEVQCILNVTRSAGLAVDGYFGSRTHSAVLSFQRAYGLVADGIVGSRTWAKLQERYLVYVCQRGGPC